jgi:hypothetical protein
MKDNVLKRDFQKRDVERLRNLVKGKYGDKTTQGIGYNGESQIDHKEGDIWEQNGKTWTIKDGLKENITKLDKFKKVSVPLFCPQCKVVMDKQLDPFYYKAFGECLDCRSKTETRLKISGEWEDHINEVHNQEIDHHIEEFKTFMQDALNESNNGYITEAGDIQKWVGGIDKERANKSLEEGIKYMESLKKQK